MESDTTSSSGVDTAIWRHETVGARAFAELYLADFDAITGELNAYVGSHPVFARLFVSTVDRARAAADSRARFEKAFAGEWDAYSASLAAQGAFYAKAGLRFAEWYGITTSWSELLIPRIVARFGSNPTLLADALVAQQRFVHATMTVLARAYIEASERHLVQRQSELEQWVAIFEHVTWGVVVIDLDGVIELANPAFGTLCGFGMDEVIGKTTDDMFAEGELARVRAVYGATARRDGRTSYEATLRGPNGTTFPALVHVARIPGNDHLPRWVLHVVDITERRRADTLERRGRELEEENRRITEASRLKSEFLANMSHELRTPLNSIIGFAELLHLQQVGPMPDKQREFVGDILSSGRHLHRLINDVLDLSKVESGTMQFRPESVDVRAIAAEVQNVLRGVAAERSMRIDVDISPDVRTVTLDPARLKQVLYNFLSNALKFSPAGQTVHLRIRTEGPLSIRIEVEDHGPGIPLEQQHRLFVEFEQLDGGRAKTVGGTGLGLALTRRLCEAQGGSVGVRSAAGEGATFFAILPRRAPRSSVPQPRRIAGANERAARILVVEDDAADQERIVSLLVTAGFAVDTAATGAQARQLATERAYDAVTLDLLLPDCAGLEVLAAIRSSSANASVPVIVISIVSEQVTAGYVVHDALPKPIEESRLLDSLRRARVAAPSAGPVLVVDDDAISARLMRETLERLGFSAIIAPNGEEALDRARRERPSAVVLDLVMPTLDGFGFLEQFRAEPAFALVPVLVWTMKDLEPDEHAAVLQRAQAVLLKDGRSVQSLAETLRAHLGSVTREEASS